MHDTLHGNLAFVQLSRLPSIVVYIYTHRIADETLLATSFLIVSILSRLTKDISDWIFSAHTAQCSMALLLPNIASSMHSIG